MVPCPAPARCATRRRHGRCPDCAERERLRDRARGLAEETVRRLVLAHAAGRTLGLLGEPRVNVLELNLDLDTTNPMHK